MTPFLIVALLLPAVAVLAQTPPATPEVTSEESTPTFSSRVNLVSVPVVVRDRDGRAAGNLKREDFQLFDKGKPQLITKFTIEQTEGSHGVGGTAAVRPPPATPQSDTAPEERALPNRYVAYLIDDIHLTGADLLQTRRAVDHHIDESLNASGDTASRAAIFTTSGRMLANFTADRDQLHKAVDSILPWTSGPDPHQDCPPVSYFVADLLVNKLLYFSGALYSDGDLARLVATNQADPALIAVVDQAATCGASLGPPTPGGIAQPGALPGRFDSEIRRTLRNLVSYGDRETDLSLGTLRDVIRKLSAMAGARNLVLVSPGFLVNRDHKLAESDVFEQAIRANVTVNAIDMRGLYTIIPGGDASTPRNASAFGSGFLAQAQIEEAAEVANVLGEMADATGGTFFHNDNDLKGGLQQLAARPEYLYVLGFSPQNLKLDGSFHALKVSVRGVAGATLQVRRGYWAPSHSVDAAEAAREELREDMFSRDEIQDIPIEVHTEFFKASETKAEVTVTARINPASLRFRKDADRNADRVTVVAGLFDSNGNYIQGLRKVLDLRLRDQTLEGLLSSAITVQENFSVAPGRYIVRVIVQDAGGQTTAARNAGLEIP